MHRRRPFRSALLLIILALQVQGPATSAPCDWEHHQEIPAGHEAMGHEQTPAPSCDHTTGQGGNHSAADCAVMSACVNGTLMAGDSRGVLNSPEASPAIAAASWTLYARTFPPDFPPPKS